MWLTRCQCETFTHCTNDQLAVADEKLMRGKQHMMGSRKWAVGLTVVAVSAVGLTGCASESSSTSADSASDYTFLNANDIAIEGTWEGVASILTVDSGPMQSVGRYEISAPVDGVFTVTETLSLDKPSELQQGGPLTTTAQQELFGVIAPDGSIRMVKINDDVAFEGWFTNEDTLQMVFSEPGEHGVVGTRTATRIPN